MKQKKKIIAALITIIILGGIFIAEELGFSISRLVPTEKEIVTLLRTVNGDTANFATQSHGKC